jgi:beta-lactam-binding protein with PASTA domain
MRRRVEEDRDAPPPGPAGPPPGWYREYWWGLLLLALAAIALVIVIIWLATRDHTSNKTTVPNVIGMQQAAAVQRVMAQGLQTRVVLKTSTAPRGQVVAETPGAGSQLNKGQTVLLDVSGAKPVTTTPTTTAKTTTVTKTTTVAVTTTQTQTRTQPTSTQTKTVTQPTVTTAPKIVTMPDEQGQDYTQAVQDLAGLGLLPQTYPVASTETQGTVVAQNPTAGSQAQTDQPVRLNVSLGPGTRSSGPIPDLTGLKAMDALVKCAQAKYTCRVVFRTAPSSSTHGKVIAQSPAGGTNAPGLTQITLYVAR